MHGNTRDHNFQRAGALSNTHVGRAFEASPNALSAPIHDRMPAVLTGAARRAWLLDPVSEPGDVDHLQDLLLPYDGADLDAYPVSPYVGNPRNTGPQCIAPEIRII